MSEQPAPDSRQRPPAEPEYQLQCAVARLEAALEELDLETEDERAEAVVTALRATDEACTREPTLTADDRLPRA
ncbi:hypothetical protein GRX03_03000 [Halovenus sp. WSH3]|uniref:Uncharacterized protein n=1 Tax=Halovenus carboxidivorans TaxID=2692199 RepID=A0A6B0T012_9EURY|nr:hypothetical protein [Halovenus carboxidivorans]MXR50577.1 hypothetical protein [Halovenus carboxidivorans]